MSSSFAVVIPAYNAALFLRESLESVLAQTEEADQIIVVDDGSTDETCEVARAFGPRVTTLLTENGGVSRARNLGIAEAHTDWVAFLDADDVWEAEKLAVTRKALQANPAAAGSYCSFTFCDSSLSPIREQKAIEYADLERELLLTGNVVGTPSAVTARRSLLKQLGGFKKELSTCADWEMWLRLAREGPMVPVEQSLVRYRVHEGQMSGDVRKLQRDTCSMLASVFGEKELRTDLRSLRGAAYARQWMVLAGSYRAAGDTRRALECIVRGMVSSPRTAAPFLVRAMRR